MSITTLEIKLDIPCCYIILVHSFIHTGMQGLQNGKLYLMKIGYTLGKVERFTGVQLIFPACAARLVYIIYQGLCHVFSYVTTYVKDP